ncbi:MAG: mechanosensitive ion channel [Magnetococcales bacterium]|nr:mechanosensitive ion channel [Magnetococcales bacterium]MBF0149480.1 mechanosensitive ion channel [Magnetococcales bacterium]MBF0631351.1 mechanosensitive ion channel [Magnetococcales bacterium]
MYSWFVHLFAIAMIVLATPVHSEPPPPASRPIWDIEVLSEEILAMGRAKTEQEMAALPADAKESSNEGLMRSALKTRLALLTELEESLKHRLLLQQSAPQRIQSETEIANALARIKKQTHPTPPDNPTNEAFGALREKLNTASGKLEELKREMSERAEIMQGLSARITTTRERQREAQRNEEKFRNLLVGTAPLDNRSVVMARVDNEKLSARVATEILKELEAEQEFEKQTVGIRDRLLELSQLEFDRVQQEVTLYQGAMNKIHNQTLKAQEAEINLKESAIEHATSQDALFLATWEANAARVRRNVTGYTALLNEIRATITEQEDKLKSEREELKNLRGLAGQGSGLNELASEIFKEAYLRLNSSRKEIENIHHGDLDPRIQDAMGRQSELVALLPGLRNQWREELQKASRGLPESRLKSFEDKAEKVFNAYRSELAEEKRILLEINLQGQRLRIVPMERKEVLAELETFVLARIFWVQDDLPVGLTMVQQLLHELFSLERPYSIINWWLEVLSRDTLTTLVRFVQSGRTAFLGGLFLVGLPLLLVWINRHINRIADTQKHEHPDPTPKEIARTHFFAFLATWLSPFYLLAIAWAIDSVGFPASLGTVGSRFMIHAALFLFLWRTNVFFLRPPAILTAVIDIPQEICHDLYRAIRIVLLAYLVCLLPWMMFNDWPFHFEILPRLGLTLFQMAVMIAIYRLIRLRSSLVQKFLSLGDKTGVLARHWNLIMLPSVLFMMMIISMDLAGYRFGARYLAANGLLSFLTIIAMTGIYRVMAVVSEKMIHHWAKETAAETGSPWDQAKSNLLARQIQGPLSWIVFLTGTLTLADYWGINESVLRSLSDVTLYSVTGADGQIQFVTLADWSTFLFCLFLVFWIARRLPHLFDWFFFSRMDADAGMQYAIVTMTRYLVVLTGIFVAFSFLKLDLAKIGWLAAAISVGLGFGLQEIVANFVSGIILLVERPIRVDDLITVGAMSGKITRINIRATTLRNFDQQEILIPNKQLITQEVTNWTLGDTRIRLVIPIGVAYGSDVDRVSAILMELAVSQPEVLSTPAPEVYFMNHGASSLDFELRVFLNHPSLSLPMRDRLNKLINKRFQLEKIEIPFPQTDIHIRSGLAMGISA